MNCGKTTMAYFSAACLFSVSVWDLKRLRLCQEVCSEPFWFQTFLALSWRPLHDGVSSSISTWTQAVIVNGASWVMMTVRMHSNLVLMAWLLSVELCGCKRFRLLCFIIYIIIDSQSFVHRAYCAWLSFFWKSQGYQKGFHCLWRMWPLVLGTWTAARCEDDGFPRLCLLRMG